MHEYERQKSLVILVWVLYTETGIRLFGSHNVAQFQPKWEKRQPRVDYIFFDYK